MSFAKVNTEFLINTTTAARQDFSQVSTLADGRFVVVWRDTSMSGGDTSLSAVRGQIFTSDGTKVGDEFLVNTTTAGEQFADSVTGLSDGRFVVTWSDGSQTGDDTSFSAVRGQLFAADGSKSGDEFLINTTTVGTQWGSAATALPGGGFVVTWSDGSETGDDTSLFAVRGQIFNADGDKSGNEFLVNSTTANYQHESSVATLAGGGFVVTWTDYSNLPSGGDVSFGAVKGQVFTSDGTKTGVEFLVNTTTQDSQYRSKIAALADGRFVVTWNDASEYPGDVRGQVFNSDGNKSGGEFVVNTATAGRQLNEEVTALADGRFVVTFNTTSAAGYSAVHGQIFAADGSKSGEEFVVKATARSNQAESALTALSDGRFVVTWSDGSRTGGDRSDFAVRAQIFDALRYDGSSAAETVTGGSLADRLFGNSGNDTLRGGEGDDSLFGGAGNDWLHGGTGDNRIDGGSGSDWVSYAGATGPVTIDLGLKITQNNAASGAGRDLILNCENVLGSDFADTLTGTSAANVIDGGAGADTMTGLGGNDTYIVDDAGDLVVEAEGGGKDTVLSSVSFALMANAAYVEKLTLIGDAAPIDATGSTVANVIVGNAGANRIDGLDGKDTLTGGAGADTFVFSTALGRTNVDRIIDFEVGVDHIELDSAIFTALTGGTGALTGQFLEGSKALVATDHIIYNSATGALFYDADGNGAGKAVQFAKLAAHLSLHDSDFVIG